MALPMRARYCVTFPASIVELSLSFQWRTYVVMIPARGFHVVILGKSNEISWLTGSESAVTVIMIIESEHCTKSMLGRVRERKTWFAMKVKFLLLLPNCCWLKIQFFAINCCYCYCRALPRSIHDFEIFPLNR